MRLIDADALIERLLESRREETETTLKLIRFIRKQPTIEPKQVTGKLQASYEPKRGRWIVRSECIYCSVCKGSRWSRVSFKELVKSFNFCPNCGARMEADE